MQPTELRNLAVIAESMARLEGNHATVDALHEFSKVCEDNFRLSSPSDSCSDRLPTRRSSAQVGREQRIN